MAGLPLLPPMLWAAGVGSWGWGLWEHVPGWHVPPAQGAGSVPSGGGLCHALPRVFGLLGPEGKAQGSCGAGQMRVNAPAAVLSWLYWQQTPAGNSFLIVTDYR